MEGAFMANKDATSDRTVISVSLTTEEKKAIKILAAERGTTVSGLITEWIKKETKGGNK